VGQDVNLYKLHARPEELDHHDQAFERVPELAWEKYEDDPDELKKREKLWARDPWTAYKYAFRLKKSFPAGEAAIAKDAMAAYYYAYYVLKKEPFPAGEAAIAKDAASAYRYASDVLKKRFPAAEATIAKSGEYAEAYAQAVLQAPFPAAEKVIARSAFGFSYAKHVLKLPAAEAHEWQVKLSGET
jgi:hypothetical protein